MKPDRRSQEQARRKWRGVLFRDAYWAIFVAVIVVGGARLAAILWRLTNHLPRRGGLPIKLVEAEGRFPFGGL